MPGLIGNTSLLRSLRPQEFTDERFGLPTVTDILSELEKPGRDPRPAFATASFAEGVETLEDLAPGMVLEGVVTNVAAFGAFVDIGVHQDGLVHVSAMSRTFVSDPRQVVKPGDVVRVRVLGVDIPRKRISLTLRLDEEAPRGGRRCPRAGRLPGRRRCGPGQRPGTRRRRGSPRRRWSGAERPGPRARGPRAPGQRREDRGREGPRPPGAAGARTGGAGARAAGPWPTRSGGPGCSGTSLTARPAGAVGQGPDQPPAGAASQGPGRALRAAVAYQGSDQPKLAASANYRRRG